MKTRSHKFPLSCEYEWTGVNRDAWDYLPARSGRHNSCWEGFESITGTQSYACWGYNGLIKAPCFTGEKTSLHSINHLLSYGKVSPFSHPARCLGLEGIVADADLWPAHDVLMQQRNVEASECAWAERSSISVRFGFSRLERLWRERASRRAACSLRVIHVAHCAAFYGLAELWGCGQALWAGSVSFASCAGLDVPSGGHRSDGASRLSVCSVAEEVNRFNMRYCAERSGS